MRRLSAITFMLVLALAGVASAEDTISALTGNNTSASPANSLASKDASTNVSGIGIHDLIGTKITSYAVLKMWYGEVGHVDAGYVSNDVGQVHAQVSDMQRRGLDGVILDWTANSALEESSVRTILAEIERSGERFPVAIMEDLSRRCCVSGLPSLTQTVIEDLNHASNNFYTSPAYMRVNGRPVVFVSGAAIATLDWQAISNSVSGNPLFFFGTEGITSTASHVYTKLDRNFNRNCGSDWVNLLQSLSSYGLRNTTPVTIVLPWNDYEKREAIEPGIDSCVTVSAEVAANQLSWQVAGNRSSIDHYSLFRSSDGLNLVKFADVASDQYSVRLEDFNIPTGSFDLYVLATGKPSMKNHLSAAVHYEAQQPEALVGSMKSSALANASVQGSGVALPTFVGKTTNTASTGTNAVQIQGRAVASIQPQDSQYLGWNSSVSQWQPLSISASTTNLSSPGPIGGTTPSTVNATTATAQSFAVGTTYQITSGTNIASALASLAGGPGTIVVPAGTYSISSGFTIADGQELRFTGNPTLNFTLNSGADAFTLKMGRAAVTGTATINMRNTGRDVFRVYGGSGWRIGSADGYFFPENVAGNVITIQPNAASQWSENFTISNVEADGVAGDLILIDSGNYASGGFANTGIINNLRSNGMLGHGMHFRYSSSQSGNGGNLSFAGIICNSCVLGGATATSKAPVYIEKTGSTIPAGGVAVQFIGGEVDYGGTGAFVDVDSARTAALVNQIRFTGTAFAGSNSSAYFSSTLAANVPSITDLSVNGGQSSGVSFWNQNNPQGSVWNQTGGDNKTFGSVGTHDFGVMSGYAGTSYVTGTSQVATSSKNYPGMCWKSLGSVWSGSGPAAGYFSVCPSYATGPNPATTINFQHTGGSGGVNYNFVGGMNAPFYSIGWNVILPDTLTGFNGSSLGVHVPLALSWNTPSMFTSVCHDNDGNLTDSGCPTATGTLPASLTTTSATSDHVTVTGMTSSGHCSLTATNANAASNLATTYISAKAANSITVTHKAMAGLTFDILCTPN